jgi:hypothetical protein
LVLPSLGVALVEMVALPLQQQTKAPTPTGTSLLSPSCPCPGANNQNNGNDNKGISGDNGRKRIQTHSKQLLPGELRIRDGLVDRTLTGSFCQDDDYYSRQRDDTGNGGWLPYRITLRTACLSGGALFLCSNLHGPSL